MNQTAIITGAAGGIGLEFAKILAGQNTHNLLLVDIRETELLEVHKQLQQKHTGIGILTLVQDLCQPDAAQNIFQFSRQHNLEIETLINNAGLGCFGKFALNNWELENSMLQVHIQALTHLTKLFLPPMIERGKGHILNVASVAAFMPGPLSAVYYASKAYILSLSESLANEVAGTGVTVTVLCPGLTLTDIRAGNGAYSHNRWLVSSAEEVAQLGYRAMKRGKAIAIPKAINKILTTLPRFLPRAIVAQAVRSIKEWYELKT